ncbi:MAG: hypothetical protein KAQ65_10615 [Candidatus Thorarchaeota archaeon]|nr:hypothetical protein [Candidatus Thorarchaeota archaeon]
MIGNEIFPDSGYAILGAATDSLVIVISIAGAVAFLVLILGVFIGTNREIGYSNEPQEHGFLRKKPLFVPSIAFVVTLLLVIALVPHPMSSYLGLNEEQIYSYEDDVRVFRVYDSVAYRSAIEIHILCFLTRTQILTVRINFLQNDTEITSIETTMNGNSLSETVTEDLVINIQPGLYEVEVPGSNYYSVSLSQPLVSGFFDEVLDWETYSFGLILVSAFFILGGICIGREERKRFSTIRIDQEPPRDGADYARRA